MEDTNDPEVREDMHEGEGDDDDHLVPVDLLELHVAIEAKEAGLL